MSDLRISARKHRFARRASSWRSTRPSIAEHGQSWPPPFRRALRQLRPTFEAEARTLADALARRGAFDGVGDLAEVYPIKVFADALVSV